MDKHRGGGEQSNFDETERAYFGLRQAFEACTALGNPARARAISSKECEAWQFLQARTPMGSIEDGDIACLLAHVGVDYAQNVRRLLCGRMLSGISDQPDSLRAADASRHISGHVARLYHRWGDRDLLNWLLDTSPHGQTERSAQFHALLALWDLHWTTLLRSSAGNPKRCRRVSDTLDYALKGCSDPLPWRAYLGQLRQAVTGRDLALRRAALAVLMHLRRRHTPIRVSGAQGARNSVRAPRRALVRIPS